MSRLRRKAKKWVRSPFQHLLRHTSDICTAIPFWWLLHDSWTYCQNAYVSSGCLHVTLSFTHESGVLTCTDCNSCSGQTMRLDTAHSLASCSAPHNQFDRAFWGSLETMKDTQEKHFECSSLWSFGWCIRWWRQRERVQLSEIDIHLQCIPVPNLFPCLLGQKQLKEPQFFNASNGQKKKNHESAQVRNGELHILFDGEILRTASSKLSSQEQLRCETRMQYTHTRTHTHTYAAMLFHKTHIQTTPTNTSALREGDAAFTCRDSLHSQCHDCTFAPTSSSAVE